MSTTQVIFDDVSDALSKYNPELNVSKPVLTKYEKTKVLGIRMEQIVRGAHPLVKVKEGANVREIVLSELEERKIPFILARTLPNGVKEIFKLEDMIIM